MDKAKAAKIAFFEVQEWEKEILAPWAAKLKADTFGPEVENALPQAAEYEIISAFIYSDLSAKTLKKLPRLKLIATRSTGFDHIDLDYCRRGKIAVANVPSYGENTVAEYAFGLILALSRRLVEANRRVRQGGFSPAGLTGFDLKGKTLAVVGVGRIGQHMVRYGRAFGMEVLGVSRSPHPKLEKKLGYRRANLEICLEKADVISFHVPSTPQTHHLVNRQNIGRIKPGAILINTSRGAVVESEAVLQAIEEGRLGGAGLDVLEEEEGLNKPWQLFEKYTSREKFSELIAAHVLREKPNVIITPHNAFNSKEAIERISRTTAKNIRAFLAGERENRVD